MIWAALGVISTPGSVLYYGLLTAEVIFTIVTGVLVFMRAWRNSLNGKGAARDDTAKAGRAGGSIGSFAFAIGGPLAGLFVFASLLTAGLALGSFALWLVPVPPMEQYERRKIAEQLRVRHGLDQLLPRSRHYGSKRHGKR
jgi:hypothetical protein